jgi:16S rRNA (cytosine967-C5)-methyltransferase
MRNQPSKKSTIARTPGLSARFLAVEALQDRSIKSLPTDRIWQLAEKYHIPSRERPLAYDLLTGCIKRRGTLDQLVEVFSGRRTQQIDSTVLTTLRMGIYQLLFEDSVPDFAAVDTTCELTRSLIGKRPVGFVNAVLRNLQRAIVERDAAITPENRMEILPIGNERGIRFSQPIFPAAADPETYLSLACSYPKWLIRRWLGRWDFDALRQILAAGNARPSLTLRSNPLRTTPEQLTERLKDEGCEVAELSDTGLLELLSHPPITELQAFKDGLFQVQDATAADVVRNLALNEGMKILDLCAGLGTKTTQLAELTGDRAEIFATDTIDTKLQKLRENADRLGLNFIKTIPIQSLAENTYENAFDLVLLDVPCSNTGVFDRRPEARWRLKETDFQLYARQNLDLLAKAETLVKPGGRIAFSTCSIDEEEDGLLIQSFCDRSNWTVQDEHLHLPEINPATNRTARTGGYWTILEKRL